MIANGLATSGLGTSNLIVLAGLGGGAAATPNIGSEKGTFASITFASRTYRADTLAGWLGATAAGPGVGCVLRGIATAVGPSSGRTYIPGTVRGISEALGPESGKASC